MRLEADLGIDSIKRVEILALVKKAVPQLPELDAATLGALDTLGDVAQHLKDSLGAAAPSPTPAPKPALTPATKHAPAAHRFVPRLVPAPAAGLARVRGLTAVAVVGGPAPAAEAVVRSLCAVGIPAHRRETPLPSDDGLVLLHGLSPVEDPAAAIDQCRRAFSALRAQGGAKKLLVSVAATGGGLGLEDPPPAARAPLAGLAALVKTAALENPAAAAVAIDVADGLGEDAIGAFVAQELTIGGLEREVGYRADGRRYSVAAEAEMARSSTMPLRAGDVVVATGGARGVTAPCLVTLARAVPARFVLLGRTALEEEPPELAGASGEAALKRALLDSARARGEAIQPAEIGRKAARVLAAREVRATLSALAEAGAEATYLAVDVTDRAALDAALAEVREAWGPVAAVVHAAGVIHDKRIPDKTDEQVARVLSTKLDGAFALLDATRDDPLKAIVLFSSVAAHGGNVGQADYAMANAGLDALAAGEAVRRPGCRVKSLAWGPWRGGMVTPALEARFEAAGVPLVGLDDGPRWMVEELASSGDPRVLLGGAPRPGPLLPGEGAPLVLHVEVDAARFPELGDHAISGPPVVPVVFAAEWMAAALAGLHPGRSVFAIEDLRVRRGLVVEGWPDRPLALAVTAEPGPDGTTLHLIDETGQIRYTATGRPADPAALAHRPAGLPAATDPRPYGGVLFHGPMFHALDPLEALGDEGARGRLVGAKRLGWSQRRTDPARIDGAMQLAVLVTEHRTGGASLPTRIRRLTVDLDATAPGPGDAWATVQEGGPDQVLFDVVALDGGGRPHAVLEGLETTRRPGGRR